MCFSPTASFAAAVVLLPAGVVAVGKAHRTHPKYMAIGALPIFFGLQQLLEGLLWLSRANVDSTGIEIFSMAYMLFVWLVWPVWAPLSAYFIEPDGSRRRLLGVLATAGAMLGAVQFLPYFAHSDWLEPKFLPHAIIYSGTVLLDFVMHRDATNIAYLFVLLTPFFISSHPRMKAFGMLIAGVVVVTYSFFSFAYVSIFCFGAAVMSLYVVHLIHTETAAPSSCAEPNASSRAFPFPSRGRPTCDGQAG
jgi:hypothetical protein